VRARRDRKVLAGQELEVFAKFAPIRSRPVAFVAARRTRAGTEATARPDPDVAYLFDPNRWDSSAAAAAARRT